MATTELIKEQNELRESLPTSADWASTADLIPMPETEVLVIAAGKVVIGHLCSDSGDELNWYSWQSKECLVDVTHWMQFPSLPEQFQARQQQRRAEQLMFAARCLVGEAVTMRFNARELQKQLKAQTKRPRRVSTIGGA